MGRPPEGPKPIGGWLGGSPPKRKNVDIAAKWDSKAEAGSPRFGPIIGAGRAYEFSNAVELIQLCSGS
jgi:hypothetical protein